MEPVAIFEVLRRQWLMVAIVTIVATVAGYGASFLLPTRYTASALVLVRPQQPIDLELQKDTREFMDFPMGGATAVETASKTYIEIMKSPAIIDQVVRELGLVKNDQAKSDRLAKFMPIIVRPAFERVKSFLKWLLPILMYGENVVDDPFTRAEKEVSKSLTFEAVIDTYTFTIKCLSKDPQQAADIANAAAKALVNYVRALRIDESKYQAHTLRNELEQSEKNESQARKAVESFKAAHSVFLYKPEYEAKLKVISELQIDLARADAALMGSRNTLANASLAAKRERLARSLREQQSELATFPDIERQLLQLEQQQKDALAAYEVVDKAYRQAQIRQSYVVPEVGVVSAATAPKLPSSPRRALITAAAFVAGLVVAASLALLLEYLNRGIRGVREFEDFAGVKVLATIPVIPRRRWRLAGLL